MKSILQKIKKFISGHDLLSPGDRILVALSGGPDSVFLTWFLTKYQKVFKIEVGAFHLNHLLRGNEAEKDEIFCRQFSETLGIPFYSKRVNVSDLAARYHYSIEEAGRNARYSGLNEILEQYNYTKIATGHNSGDNAETILLNLIKGTSIKGIAGIPVRRGKIIRPLLTLSKDEILETLNENELKFTVDRSNSSMDFERNFIRISILPSIKQKLNPSIEQALLVNSVFLQNVNRYLSNIIDLAVSDFDFKKLYLEIPLIKLNRFHTELEGILIKELVEKKYNTRISFKDVAAILDLKSKQPGKKADISQNLICYRERQVLLVKQKSKEINTDQSILIGDQIDLGEYILGIRTSKRKFELMPEENNLKEYIDRDSLKSNTFTIRNWRPGDFFYPIGMRGSKKVSDFLNDIKIPPSQKKRQLVLTNNEKLVWVIGRRLDNRFRIKKKTTIVVELCLKKKN